MAEGQDVEEMEQDGAEEKGAGGPLPQGLVGQMGTGTFFHSRRPSTVFVICFIKGPVPEVNKLKSQ